MLNGLTTAHSLPKSCESFLSVVCSIKYLIQPCVKRQPFSEDRGPSHKKWETETVFVADRSNLMFIAASVRHLVSTPCRDQLQHKMLSFLQ